MQVVPPALERPGPWPPIWLNSILPLNYAVAVLFSQKRTPVRYVPTPVEMLTWYALLRGRTIF
jgi:hypothetical protein